MIVPINAPAVRSLTPNEKTVYKLVREGKTPAEIADTMRIPLKTDFTVNYHDVPPETVMGLIVSIREKGWEISIKEEDNPMPKNKIPPEKLRRMKTLRDEGKTIAQISEELNVARSTVQYLCKRFTIEEAEAQARRDFETEKKTEPVPEATDTDPKAAFRAKQDDTPADISIPVPEENVKPPEEIHITGEVLEAIAAYIDLLRKDIEAAENDIRNYSEKIRFLKDAVSDKAEKISSLEARLTEAGYKDVAAVCRIGS